MEVQSQVTEEYLTIWEAALRWSNIDYRFAEPTNIPLHSIDLIKNIVEAQRESQLFVMDDTGRTYRDWRYINAQDYHPHPDQHWDKSEGHRRRLWREVMREHVAPRDEAIKRHEEVVENNWIDKDYLSSFFIIRSDFTEWVITNNLRFPYFWYNHTEADYFFTENRGLANLRAYKKTSYSVNGYKQEPYVIPNSPKLAITHPKSIGSPDPLIKTAKLNNEDIDRIWKRLGNDQQLRLILRGYADSEWRRNPSLRQQEIISGSILSTFPSMASYEEKTRKGWIKDLDPTPVESRRGRPKKNN